MTEVINLRQRRKAKVRTEKEKQAAQNRALHGQSKAQKHIVRYEKEHASRKLDRHKLERDE